MSTTDGEMAGVFIPLLGHIIKAGELISSPKIKQILGDDAVKRLRHRKCPEEKKIKGILDIIGQRKNTSNWTILIEVLKYGCDFIFVPELLLKQYTSTVETQLRSIVSVIKDEDIDTKPLSQTCKCHGLLTEQDIRDISMECYSRGDKAALIVLIDRVVKPHPQSWFKEFLDCMIRAGMKEITRKIELIIKGAQIKWKEVNIDDHWRTVIMELFHGQIVQNVIPSGLLCNLGPVFSLDYGWVNELIEGDFVSYDDIHAWEHLINLFEKTLSQNIRSQEILPYLREKGIISVKDSEEVTQKYKNFGESEAVFLLLTYLPKRKPNVWYNEFMNILYENGSEHIVKEIDPEKYEKIQAHRSVSSDRMGIDNTEPDKVNMGYNTQVNYTSAIEQNKKSSDNLSSTQTENEMTNHYRMAKGKVDESYNRLSKTSKTNSSHFELLFDKNVNRDTAMGTRENSNNITTSDNDSVGTDDLSSSDSDNEWKEDFILRNYQIELVKAALDSKNCIIVAPNGSGKTYVALKIIQDHFEKTTQRSPKVVFLVEMSAQGKKQADKCKVCLSKYRVKLITEEMQTNTKKPKFLSLWLKRSDILIIPAQLVVNALKNKEIKIEDFTLMFFYECHHTDASHPYVQIMHYYIDLKLDRGVNRHKSPVVVGLTALVSMERAFSGDIAIKKIQKMMANLDARELCTVNICLPKLEILCTRKRTKNYFGEALVLMMENIESYMIGSLYAPFMPHNGSILKGPTEKGAEPYTQWISKLWRETAKLNNSDARRYFTTCRQYLDVYNKVLIIYEDARVEDAMQYLERNLKFINEGMYIDATVEKMLNIYQKRKLLLAACVGNVHHINPKLEALKDIVFKLYTEKPDSRVIVFTKTRESVQAIGNWMNEIDGLSCLNPVIFVGTEASGEKGGMTKNDQDNILQHFKEGKHKIIIATSVGEEGLDIQKCNLVIRYDHMTNEIAMAQVRGRGWNDGSKYYVVASEEKMTAEKEELKMIREARINQAIIHLQNFKQDNEQRFIQEIEDLQLEAIIQRELENTNRGGRIIGDFEFEMKCEKCNEFICMSKDIKKIQRAHHAVIGEEIANHIYTIRMPKPTFEDDNIKMGCGKVNCNKCGKNLGSIFIYRKAQFPVLKIENLLVSDSLGNTNVYKKWKKSPFVIQDLSSQNLLDRARGIQYIMED
ncbi:ATP-dependent RNA helicase DHX58-like isoform X2 [Mytilus edulis]|uniref:ATP-dependent RNA helicase DHX58-like isoform X2 n=1 Tax=Mytilus edulis TaxID=6550 RepID=UPI0039EE6B9E